MTTKTITYTTVEAIQIEGKGGPATLTLESQWKCFKAFRDSQGRELVLVEDESRMALLVTGRGSGSVIGGTPGLLVELGLHE